MLFIPVYLGILVFLELQVHEGERTPAIMTFTAV